MRDEPRHPAVAEILVIERVEQPRPAQRRRPAPQARVIPHPRPGPGPHRQRFPAPARVILQGLKTYGMILADNGTSWYITGASDPRWDDDDLNQLKDVPGSAFEAVVTETRDG